MQIMAFRQNAELQPNSAQRKQKPAFGCFLHEGCGICDELVRKIDAIGVKPLKFKDKKPLTGPYILIHAPEQLAFLQRLGFLHSLTDSPQRKGYKEENLVKSWVLGVIENYKNKFNLNHTEAAKKLAEETEKKPQILTHIAKICAQKWETVILNR